VATINAMTGHPALPSELHNALAAANAAEPPSTTDVLAAVTTGLHALAVADVPPVPVTNPVVESTPTLTARA